MTKRESIWLGQGQFAERVSFPKPEAENLTPECVHCGAEPMEDQSGPCTDWCACHNNDLDPDYAGERWYEV